MSKLQDIVKDRGAWHAAVHGIAESDTMSQLSSNNNNKVEVMLITITYSVRRLIV